MSSESQSETDDGGLDWREEVVSEQVRGVPKERGRTYYYSDGLFDRKQMWVTHSPGCDIPLRVNKVWSPGFSPEKDYEAFLEMNISSEMDAYRLYLALQAYFNDVRTQPWFLQDVEL